MENGSSQMTCVLRLDTLSRGWDKSMHKLLKGIRDVTYTIDATRGLAYVSGKISPEIILRIRKAKKHAQLIHMDYGYNNPFYPPENTPSAATPNPPFNPQVSQENIPINMVNPYHYTEPPPPPQEYYQYSPYSHHVAVPYYYPYSPPQQLPTRDPATGEQQCTVM